MSTSIWAASAWLSGGIVHGVRIDIDERGLISAIATGVAASAQDVTLEGVVYPGAVNAHSHAFHRLLRGRTHGAGGSFWTWRDLMYREAARLEPESYRKLASAVFAEMVCAGWTSVAEFHYVHHRLDGRPYDESHAMELALAAAATDTGIRLTLLDTCYLTGGMATALSPEQQRFGDGSVRDWMGRLESLRSVVASEFDADSVNVGAAVHSVRAVPADDLTIIATELDPDLSLHIHLSEQPAENQACLAATGSTPSELLSRAGLLSPRLSAVHATHLTEHDIELLADAGTTVVMCPTTEADLGDGIGPAHRLAQSGATIALGTDQHAVVDPLIEARALEHGERLSSGERGRFTPAQLVSAMTAGGAGSVNRNVGVLEVGAFCDLIELDGNSIRTMGSDLDQLVFSATATDVLTVVRGGRVLARAGLHADVGDPAELLRTGMESLRSAS